MKKFFVLTALVSVFCISQVHAQASLWVLNPDNNWYWRPARIEQASLSIKPAGVNFEMGLYLTFSSEGSGFSGDIQLETLLNFSLPQGSHILDSWLWVEEDIVQGKIIDRWTASNIYEGIVNRRRDPSVLFKNGKDEYELRVYPMKPGETRKVKITYLVPAVFTNGKASVPIPADIIRASSVIPSLHTLVWLKDGWTHPDIPEINNASFSELSDENLGTYYRYDISDQDLKGNLSFRLDAPLTNGIFLSVSQTDTDAGMYQLALDFNQFIQQDENAKIAILIDYESSKSNMSREQVFTTLQQYMYDNYTERDSFNLFFSRYEIESYSDVWMPVTAANLNEAFADLKEGFMTLYSNLPGLIAKGNRFVRESGSGHMLLFTNADNFGSQEKANGLLKDIRELNPVPIHIADFQNQNFSNHYIGNRWYYGQEYLFINLSRITGSQYEKINQHTNLYTLCSGVFGSLSGSITAFDLYTTASNGFCYARYNGSSSEIFHPGEYFIQTGRFIGQAPFTLNLTGLYNNEPFSQMLTVNADELYPGDSMVEKSWYGNHIRELEWGVQDNEMINRVLSESIEHRVLSRYSAFLCLEPSDTVSVCVNCIDESRLTGLNRLQVEDTDRMILYPNPCSDFVSITFESGTGWNDRETTVKIYSVMGELVRSFQPVFMPGTEVTVEWDLSADGGSKVSVGYYLVVVNHLDETLKKTLVVQ